MKFADVYQSPDKYWSDNCINMSRDCNERARDYPTYKKVNFKPEFSDCPLCGLRLKRDHIAWRKHIQKLDGKIYAISNAYRCTGCICGKLYRSAEAEILSLPYRTYSLDVMAEIGYLRHEEKRSIPEICYFLISLDIEISERECYDLVHAFEDLIATRDTNLD